MNYPEGIYGEAQPSEAEIAAAQPMSTLPDTIPCKKCGGEGHLVCRPNIYTLVGDLYTVDCEDCDNSTNDEHADEAKAIEQWNTENSLGANAEMSHANPKNP